jgi:transcriptional regulator with XRE-family HTH domain
MEANRIKERRQELGLSQVELARRARMASPNLSAIECGKLAPWPKARKALAEVLGLPETDLFPDGQDKVG